MDVLLKQFKIANSVLYLRLLTFLYALWNDRLYKVHNAFVNQDMAFLIMCKLNTTLS
jgi:hypothetical protein